MTGIRPEARVTSPANTWSVPVREDLLWRAWLTWPRSVLWNGGSDVKTSSPIKDQTVDYWGIRRNDIANDVAVGNMNSLC